MPKPKTKKRKFIDPKKDRTLTFKVIHRDQRDPLAVDDEAPQRLLQPLINNNNASEIRKKRKEDEREHGVFYEDDYDYLQHLKEGGKDAVDFSQLDRFLLGKDDSPKVKLPEAVFASKGEEEEVGLLNKAAPRSGPRLDWDPEIVAALDDDFDFDNPDNELEDDFMAVANEEKEGDEEETTDSYDTDDYEDEARDEVPSLNGSGFSFDEEETGTRFTNYSMSSSAIRRNEGLQLLDDRFERFFEKYDRINVGALDCDEIEGSKKEDSDVMSRIMEEHRKNKESERVRPDLVMTLDSMKEQNEDDVDAVNDEFEKVKIGIEDKWDCESVLSTYSNIYNHPKLISERKIDPIKIGRQGMPKDVLGKGLTMAALKRLDAENGRNIERNSELVTCASRVSELSFRNKHETKEEKKARKEGMKEYKRERRVERKANRDAFREERVRQEKIGMNNRNMKGIKLV